MDTAQSPSTSRTFRCKRDSGYPRHHQSALSACPCMLRTAGAQNNAQDSEASQSLAAADCFVRVSILAQPIVISGWQSRLPATPWIDQVVRDTRQQADIVICMLRLAVRRAHVCRMLLKDLLYDPAENSSAHPCAHPALMNICGKVAHPFGRQLYSAVENVRLCSFVLAINAG